MLREDERRWLEEDETERCGACGHLMALHNHHCCEFCIVPGCPCEWGKVPPIEGTTSAPELTS